MGILAKIIAGILFVESIWSLAVMIDRYIYFSAARKQSREFAPKAAFQRALQQLHALLLVWEIFECHRASYNSPPQRREAVISQSPARLWVEWWPRVNRLMQRDSAWRARGSNFQPSPPPAQGEEESMRSSTIEHQ